MSAAMIINFRVEKNAPLITRQTVTLLMKGDHAANVIQVEMLDAGEPVLLDGYKAALYLRRRDGIIVRNPGAVSGNVITVPLDESSYNMPGNYSAILRLTSPQSEKRTILRITGLIESDGEGTIIDPTGTIPSYEELDAIMEELGKALEEAREASSDAKISASAAEAAAKSATSAAGNANIAATAAGKAAENANAQAENASQKAQQAEQAATDVSAAAKTANEKAQLAATKAALAEGAAERANQAETTANAAAKAANDAISGVSASATTLSAGSPATASASFVSGSWKIAFGIPQGAKGDPGDGDVSSVDNISPLNGNVQLNALAMQGDCNNANNALTIGIYACSPTTTNIPVAQWGTIFNISNSFTFDHQNSYIFQFFYPIYGGPTWKRSILNTGQWTAWTLVALEAYPVGAIYISYVATSPASIFGGTWTQLKDRFLLGLGDSGGAAGATGGAATVTLTEAQLPAHAHGSVAIGMQVMTVCNGSPDISLGTGSALQVKYSGNYVTTSAGANQAHENMPPYLAVYMWRRTA